MGTISLQIPVSGALNLTEDPKIAADFTTLQTLLNGNVDRNNLAGGVARMTAIGTAGNVTAADGQFILASGTAQTVTLPPVSGGATLAVMAITSATTVTVVTQASVNLNFLGQLGAGTSMTLGPGAAAIFYSDGGSWFVVSGQRDTGWTPLTLINGWVQSGLAYTVAARLIGDRVWLRGAVGGSTGTVATLPAQFRPTSNVQSDGGNAVTTAGALSGVGTSPAFDGFSYSVL